METTSIFDRFLTEFQTILILLERPIVQFQLITIVGTLGIAWGIAQLLNQSLNRIDFTSRAWLTDNRIRIGSRYLLFPVLATASLQIATFVFQAYQLPANILRYNSFIMLGILVYFLMLGWALDRYDRQAVLPYHRRIFLPLLLAIILYIIISRIINLTILLEVSLLPFANGAITVEMVLRSLLIIYTFATVAYLLQRFQKRVSAEQPYETAAITSILIVTRYAVIGLGLMALGASFGLNLATIAVIGGGLSIGIGFGLQQIVANFIAGIFLLFEQSLRPGDVIDIDGQLGQVRQVDIRSTTIVTNNNIEIVVPNEKLLTNEVTTYTKGSSLVRVPIEFGVSYDSDPQLIREMVLRTVSKHGSVKESPAPVFHFVQFGASSIDFKVFVWLDRPLLIPRIRSDLYFMIWETFKKNGVEIPFPQTDIHVRTTAESETLSDPTEGAPITLMTPASD